MRMEIDTACGRRRELIDVREKGGVSNGITANYTKADGNVNTTKGSRGSERARAGEVVYCSVELFLLLVYAIGLPAFTKIGLYRKTLRSHPLRRKRTRIPSQECREKAHVFASFPSIPPLEVSTHHDPFTASPS